MNDDIKKGELRLIDEEKTNLLSYIIIASFTLLSILIAAIFERGIDLTTVSLFSIVSVIISRLFLYLKNFKKEIILSSDKICCWQRGVYKSKTSLKWSFSLNDYDLIIISAEKTSGSPNTRAEMLNFIFISGRKEVRKSIYITTNNSLRKRLHLYASEIEYKHLRLIGI